MRMRLLTLSAALLAASCGRDEVISIGQSIHHDDFEYSVQSLERKDRIGNLHANGLFYVVTFEVRNGAKQVEHKCRTASPMWSIGRVGSMRSMRVLNRRSPPPDPSSTGTVM